MNDEESKKKCLLCNADGAMAAFGVLMGLVILGMSLDLIRRIRKDDAPAIEMEDDNE